MAPSWGRRVRSRAKVWDMQGKEPLFRKVNTTARGVHHFSGGEYRHQRNTKAEKASEAKHQSMHGKKQRGLDYTPLFRFLLSKVGQSWDEIYSEAAARLDKPEPIFWVVALPGHDRHEAVRVGESTYVSGLYVDADGILRRVNPDLGPEHLTPNCPCCTHTFNGHPFVKKFAR
jgi:hypothetical protein